MTSAERWLAALWPWIRSALPPRPAVVVELGCGSLGGFVPRLDQAGYEALGVDPQAPAGAAFDRVEFERSRLPAPVDAVVACTSLHHVGNPAGVVEKIAQHLHRDGVVIVVEWDWQSFDEATAQWCFARLGPSQGEGWLHRRRDEWTASGQSWGDYVQSWAEHHGVHRADLLVGELDHRFRRLAYSRGPYFFCELANTSEADERQAIAAGRIRATRIDYVGTLA